MVKQWANELPRHVYVVIIGGGVIGRSVAYNVAKYGCGHIVLLE